MNTPLPLATAPFLLLLDQTNIFSVGSYNSLVSGSSELGSVYALSSITPQQGFIAYCIKTCEIHICTIYAEKHPWDASLQGFTDDFSTKTCWPTISRLVISSMVAKSRSRSPKSVLLFQHICLVMLKASPITAPSFAVLVTLPTANTQLQCQTGPQTSKAAS